FAYPLAPRPSPPRRSSDLSAIFEVFVNPLRGTVCQSSDCWGWMNSPELRKCRTTYNKKVVYIPHLQVIIHRRCFRIISHNHASSVMSSVEDMIKFFRYFIFVNDVGSHFF